MFKCHQNLVVPRIHHDTANLSGLLISSLQFFCSDRHTDTQAYRRTDAAMTIPILRQRYGCTFRSRANQRLTRLQCVTYLLVRLSTDDGRTEERRRR